MTSADRIGGRRELRITRPSVLALEGRTLLAASPTFAHFPVPKTSAPIFATQIIAGTDGDLWFTAGDAGPSSNAIDRITPQGQITEFPLLTPAGGFPPELAEITAGPNSAIWAVDSANNQVDEFSHDGQVQSFPIPVGPGGSLGAIVAGTDGYVWLDVKAVSGPGTIDRLTPRGA